LHIASEVEQLNTRCGALSTCCTIGRICSLCALLGVRYPVLLDLTRAFASLAGLVTTTYREGVLFLSVSLRIDYPVVFFFLHYGPIMFSRSTLAQNSLFTWLFPASADSSPKSSQPSSYVAISATGAASSLADPKTAISPGSTCNLSADTLAAWHQPYHDFLTCCVFIFLWQIHTIFIHLHEKATCWPLISETEIFMIDSQNHSNESIWMDVSRNLACFRECQGFFMIFM